MILENKMKLTTEEKMARLIFKTGIIYNMETELVIILIFTKKKLKRLVVFIFWKGSQDLVIIVPVFGLSQEKEMEI